MLEILAPFVGAETLAGRLAEVSPVPLTLGIAFQLLKLSALGDSWRKIVQAALPGATIRRRQTLTPYLAGTGVNAVVPAKAGHATRLVLARRLIPGATYETLAGTMLAESLLGAVPVLLLVAIAFATGLLPGALGGIPVSLPGWLTPSPVVLAAACAAACVVAGGVCARARVRRRAMAALARIGQGLAVIGAGRHLRGALAAQLAAWAFRLASIACFLAAFGLSPTPTLVLLVVVAQVLATLVPPVGPAGVGAQQGLLVVVLGGVASAGTALAFGVGMQAAVIVSDVLAGALAVALAGDWRLVIPGRLRAGASAQTTALAPVVDGG